MLSTKVFSSSSHAQKYYSHADYYGSEVEGIWFGSGTKDLNVSGNFIVKDCQKFKDILDGKMPNGKILGNVGTNGEVIHRPGIDLTFSSPKSFSIQMHVIANGKEKAKLEDARMRALQATLSYIEKSGIIYTRKGAQGKIREPVRKLTYALFVHTTNRKLEPQDHVHCFLANATKCNDGKYRTIAWDNLMKSREGFPNMIKYFGQIYRNELLREVEKLGYKTDVIRLSDGSTSFELQNIPQKLIDTFSTRRKELVELFKYYGVKTKEGKDSIVINSRQAKQSVSEAKLKEMWHDLLENTLKKSRLKNLIANKTKAFLEKTIFQSNFKDQGTNELTKEMLVSLALSNVTYHNSIFSKEQLIGEAVKLDLGKFTAIEVSDTVDNFLKNKFIVPSDKNNGLYTSKDLLEKEEYIIKFGRQGINKTASIIKPHNFNKRIRAYQSNKDFTLNKQQTRAIKHVLTSKDKITAIEGLPGVGKSTVLDAVREISAKKVMLLGTAPTASAAKTLEQSAKIESRTLHSFIGKYQGYLAGRGTKESLLRTRNEYNKSIMFVDESSLVATRQMYDLVKLSEILKFRIVLVGDTKQLGAVEAGKPFDQLLGVINSVKLSKVIRQEKQSHIEAIEKAANNKIPESFSIHKENIVDHNDFISKSISKYLSLTSMEQEKTILVAPKRQDRDDINREIVCALYEKGKLSDKSQDINILKTVDLKKGDYNFVKSYQAGDVVRFYKDYKTAGIKSGEDLTIHKTNQTSNVLIFKKGLKTIRFQLKYDVDYEGKLEVFQKDILNIREGVKLRITKNDYEKNLINSDTVYVNKINKLNNTVTLQVANRLETKKFEDLKHIDYGYCITVHSSQGKTTDKLIAAVGFHSKLNNQKLWLVFISRHKFDLHIYMENVAKIQDSIKSNKGIKSSALDVRSQTQEKQAAL